VFLSASSCNCNRILSFRNSERHIPCKKECFAKQMGLGKEVKLELFCCVCFFDLNIVNNVIILLQKHMPDFKTVTCVNP